jgi:hypothetical protein
MLNPAALRQLLTIRSWNTIQRLVFWATFMVIAGLVTYPPWSWSGADWGGTEERWLLVDPPKAEGYRIALEPLLRQVSSAALAGGVLLLVAGRLRRDSQNPPLAHWKVIALLALLLILTLLIPVVRETLLIEAVKKDYPSMVTGLLAIGTNADARGDTGQTALAEAAFRGHVSTVRALLAANPDVNARSEDGLTPLISAAQGGDPTLLEALIERGADVNARSSRGWSALSIAAGYPRNETATRMLSVLLDHGADIRTESGVAALTSAIRSYQVQAIDLLLANGVDLSSAETRTRVHAAVEQSPMGFSPSILRRLQLPAEGGASGQLGASCSLDTLFHVSLVPVATAVQWVGAHIEREPGAEVRTAFVLGPMRLTIDTWGAASLDGKRVLIPSWVEIATGTLHVQGRAVLDVFGLTGAYDPHNRKVTISGGARREQFDVTAAAFSDGVEYHGQVGSPHGYLEKGWRVDSPDTLKTALEGKVVDATSGWVLAPHYAQKAFAWHPDSCHFATLAHGFDNASHVDVYRLGAGLVRRYDVPGWYRQMHFRDERSLILSTDTGQPNVVVKTVLSDSGAFRSPGAPVR